MVSDQIESQQIQTIETEFMRFECTKCILFIQCI